MSEKASYQVAFTRKNEPGVMVYAPAFASSASEAKNIVKMNEARRGNVITVRACVKR